MSKAFEKHDYEILFNDSAEYFLVKNCKMVQEGDLIRFICFKGDKLASEEWYPMSKIHRIKRYHEVK